ncbi:MAG: Cysteine desulfurase [uncultured Rubrobacteraceae bacterium]|uniref:Cysteine desulfurase n=1 Tax=uncultured Rubrobacteraceae bacterium TaxID=349277 RepID=A0A6J4Q0X7_9ACTN|nr:MAG: Cysteine desulfurase [uncultured Rubrobacteraceae bacterium]
MAVVLCSQRELFEIPEDITYLNCAYMSPQLRAVRAVGEEAVARKSRPWEVSPRDFFENSETARKLFAQLVGGNAEGVAIVPSVSYGMAVATANVPLNAGQSVVMLEEQFPSNVYPWRELAKRTGAEIVTVPRPVDHDWTSAILERVDGRTAVVAVPNCHWTDGSVLDLVRTGERAREVGAALVVDATQSLGAYPLDVSEVRPDFLVSAAYKWLLGPYSLGFLYVGEGYREGVPIEHNWISREGSEDFARLIEYTDAYGPGARRYDVGERSNFVLLPMAIEALRQILAWGVENTAASLRELTTQIEEEAEKLGMDTVPASMRAEHMIGIGLGPEAPKDLTTRLAEENVFVSVRGRNLRVSPHLYNTERDVERLFDSLNRHVRAGAG